METKVSKVSLIWVIIMVGFAMHMLADRTMKKSASLMK